MIFDCFVAENSLQFGRFPVVVRDTLDLWGNGRRRFHESWPRASQVVGGEEVGRRNLEEAHLSRPRPVTPAPPWERRGAAQLGGGRLCEGKIYGKYEANHLHEEERGEMTNGTRFFFCRKLTIKCFPQNE